MKQYVDVIAYHDQYDHVTPLYIVWENHIKYSVDKVLKIERAASLKYGGVGLRYTVRIHGQMRWLYYENPKWFIEKIE